MNRGKAPAEMKALTPQQIGSWERDGFLILRNFADARELAEIQTIISRLAEQNPPDERIHIDVDPALADREDLPASQTFRALIHAAHASPELRRVFTLRPKTLDVVEDLLGPDVVFYTDQTFLKPPGGSPAPPHQDNAYWEPFWSGKGKLSIWLALDDSTLERGCTHFVPGSHRAVLEHERDFQKDALFGGAVEGLKPESLDAVPVELEAGDCCIHHGEIIHFSGPNASDKPRRGHVAIYFSGRCTFTDQRNEFFTHDFIPARGAVFPGCVGWRE